MIRLLMLEKLKVGFAISSMTIKQNIELSGGEIGKIPQKRFHNISAWMAV